MRTSRVDNFRLWDLRVEVEVEVFARACSLEARAAQSQIELLPVAALDFIGEQTEEKLAVGEVVVDGLSRAQI
jgi:hypothetical protein